MGNIATKYFNTIYHESREAIACVDTDINVIYATPFFEYTFLKDNLHAPNLSCIFSNREIFLVKSILSNNISDSVHFIYLPDKSAKKCLVIPTEYNGETYGILIFSDENPDRLDNIEKNELRYALQNTKNSIHFSTGTALKHIKSNLSTEKLEKLTTSFRNIYYARRKINNLYYLVNGRSASGKIHPINVNDYINHITPRIVKIIGSDRIKINLKLSKTFSIIDTSYEILDILVCNIVSNSVKNKPENTDVTTITISTSTKNEKVLIAFSDNGPGLHNINKILNCNYNADDYYNTPTAGTGLLVIKNIAMAHGGEMFSSPADEKGLTVGVVFPQTKLGGEFKEDDFRPYNLDDSSLVTGLCEVIDDYKYFV